MSASALRRVGGVEYLDLVTRLLQAQRRADPTGGLWEAADLQWWWRLDQHTGPNDQVFVMEGENPLAALVFSPFGRWVGVELLGADDDRLWDIVLDDSREGTISMMVRTDDRPRIERLTAAGFTPGETRYGTGWLDTESRPAVPALADGYELVAYEGGPHPMRHRNGDHVADRLAECSLYRRDLDLAIRYGDDVAGYALFWADPVTGVGLVEPMRVEDDHAGRGLATVLLAAGLDRLAAHGCSRLKVTYEPHNEAARRLYEGAGFVRVCESRAYNREQPA